MDMLNRETKTQFNNLFHLVNIAIKNTENVDIKNEGLDLIDDYEVLKTKKVVFDYEIKSFKKQIRLFITTNLEETALQVECLDCKKCLNVNGNNYCLFNKCVY